MSTITLLNGRRYFTYSNDHPPAHVHVSGAGGKCKFNLNGPRGPVECVAADPALRDHELNAIRKQVVRMLDQCCRHWRLPHGSFA